MLPRRAGFLLPALLYVVLGAMMIQAVPPGEAPDETWHIAYAEAISEGRLPEYADTYQAHHPPLYYLWPAIWLRVAALKPLPLPEHNPRYPFATAVFRHPPDDPLVAPIGLLRTLSSWLGLPVVALTWSAGATLGRRLGRGGDRGQYGRPEFRRGDDKRRRGQPLGVATSAAAAAAAAGLAALWPQWLFISHTISNDVLATLAGALVYAGLTRWMVAPAERTMGATVMVAGGIAVGVAAKLNAMLLLPGVALIALVVGIRGRCLPRSERRQSLQLILAIVCAGLFTVFLHALLVPESLRRLGASLMARGVESAPVSATAILSMLTLTAETFWMRFGWMNVAAPMPLQLTGLLICGGCLFGLGQAWRHGDGRLRLTLTATALLSCVLVLAYVRNLQIDSQPQGRLLFPVLPAVLTALAVGWIMLGVRIGCRPYASAVGLVLALTAVNVWASIKVIQPAYDSSRLPEAGIFERILPPSWDVVAWIDSPTQIVEQTMVATSNELERIELPVFVQDGPLTLSMAVVDADGVTVASALQTLVEDGHYNWQGVDLTSAAISRGERLTLTMSIADDGRLLLWGAPGFYDGGAMYINGRETEFDIVMLWRHAADDS